MSMVQFLSFPDNSQLLSVCSKLGSSHVVSLIGAGGKTSTLFWLARELHKSGARVLVTTTTHMYLPDPDAVSQCIIDSDFGRRLEFISLKPYKPGIVACFAAFDEQSRKVTGCLPQEIEVFKNADVVDVILVEADGARHCILKAPAEHEPSIPACSDVVIAVSGGDALLRPADPARIHRWTHFAELTGVGDGDILDEQVFDRLLVHPQGMFKNTPVDAARHWLVNTERLDDAALLAMLQSLAYSHSELDGLWLGDMRKEQPFTHAYLRTNNNNQESQ